MKKLVSILMTLILVFALAATSFANSKVDLNKVADEYGFETTSKAPTHITPIVVNSEEELQQVIELIENNKVVEIQTNITDKNTIDTLSLEIQPTNISSRFFEVSKTMSVGLKQYLEARIEIYSSGSFGQINNVNSITTYMAGYSPGVDYTPDPYASGSFIASDRQSVRIYGAGDVSYYILIDGVVKLYQTRERIEGTFRL